MNETKILVIFLNSMFYVIDMNVVDIILGYYWKYYVGIVDVNVQMEF